MLRQVKRLLVAAAAVAGFTAVAGIAFGDTAETAAYQGKAPYSVVQ